MADLAVPLKGVHVGGECLSLLHIVYWQYIHKGVSTQQADG